MEHGVSFSGLCLDVSFHTHSDTGRFLNLFPGAISAVAEAHVTGGQEGSGNLVVGPVRIFLSQNH